jgi:hypothetical protein
MWQLERGVMNLVFLLVYEPDEENCKDDRGDLDLLVKNVRRSSLTRSRFSSDNRYFLSFP